jgi:hypothetical protein
MGEWVSVQLAHSLILLMVSFSHSPNNPRPYLNNIIK